MMKKRIRSSIHHKNAKKPNISHLRRPEELSLEHWQTALRKQFAQTQEFQIKNTGRDPIFSEFLVTNPQSGGEYRVAIRGLGLGDNYCSCPDFSVNTLGTCKHIEWTLVHLQKKKGAKSAFARGFRPAYSEIYLRYGARREVIFRPGTQCPTSLVRLARTYFDKQGILPPKRYQAFDAFLKQATRDTHEVRCYEDTLAFIAQVRDNIHRKQTIEKIFSRGIHSGAFNSLLKVRLYPYQRKGALFAAQAGRCLIADDMGLGKTIQAIAAVEILAKTVGLERVLIIAPTSLKHQWKQEIEKFCSRSAAVVEGSLVRREGLYASESFYKITNYDVVERDCDLIGRWRPDLIILDEAQRIKNWKTRRAQSVKKLQSQYALVLTGTPLENRLEELHSIVEFVDRFHLGPQFRFLAEHQHVDERGKVIGYWHLARIGQSLESILIRRTKQEVLKELPERLEKNYFVPMTDQQMKHHEENRETVARIVAKWQRYGFLSETDQRILMIALQNMRMSCNSTYLLDKKTDYGVKADELIAVLKDIFEQPDAKVVIFSQWLGTHEIIEDRFRKFKHNHVLFHGGVPGIKRKDLIHQFKEDPRCRVFLSTDAGGVGLNLQNASAVINMDLPWNPAVLEQRIGRVHRLGQHRPVRVVNFVAQGTIEHGMLSLLSFKQSLFAGVLDNGQDEVFLGGTRLKRFMDSVEKATGSIPQSMPAVSEIQTDAEERPYRDAAGKRPSKQQPAWNELTAAGLSFLNKLSASLGGQSKSLGETLVRVISESKITTDAATGQKHLNLPIPPKDILEGVANLLSHFAKQLK